jgi:peptidoglycan/LPS O-acetylase OafA/YrhL
MNATENDSTSRRVAGSGSLPVAANLNSVRGLTCLLVVALHVVGDEASNGLHLPMTSVWHYAMASIEFLRIPMFTALSGYLYAGRRTTRPEFAGFWAKKFRRLFVPLGFVTLAFWYLRRHTYADAEPLWQALLFSFGHLWYIQALILLFAGISICDAWFRPGHAALVLAGLAAIMLAQSGVTLPTFFSLYGVCYLAPYFLFGIILREHPAWLHDRRLGTIAIGIVVIVLTAQQLGIFGLTDGVTLLQLPAALAGMAGVVLLLQRLPGNAVLATIGGYSYTIYLWHIMASAAVRGVLLKVGVANVPLVFTLCFIAAVIAPIMLYHIARRIPLLSVMITGEKRIVTRSAIRRDRPGGRLAVNA